jgi:hypothetical protein
MTYYITVLTDWLRLGEISGSHGDEYENGCLLE